MDKYSLGCLGWSQCACAQGIVLHGPEQPLRDQQGALAVIKSIACVDANSSLKEENHTLGSRNGHKGFQTEARISWS